MPPHLMTFQTWPKAKQSAISDLKSALTLRIHKQAFIAIQIKSGESASAFVERFYQQAQVIVTSGPLDLNESMTLAISWSPHIITCSCT